MDRALSDFWPNFRIFCSSIKQNSSQLTFYLFMTFVIREALTEENTASDCNCIVAAPISCKVNCANTKPGGGTCHIFWFEFDPSCALPVYKYCKYPHPGIRSELQMIPQEYQGWIGYTGTHVPMFVHKLGLIKPRQT